MASDETIYAETTKEEVANPDENVFIDGFGAVFAGLINTICNGFLLLDNVTVAVFVDLDLVTFFRVGVADGGNRDGDNLATVGADFDFVAFDF